MNLAVLIPAAHAERTLAQALASVAAQTLTPQRLLVVVPPDDEATTAIARQHGVELLSEHTSSPARARNLGLQRLRDTADWVAFLDADDWWDPGWLAAAALAIQRRPEAVLAAGAVVDAFADGSSLARPLPEDLEARGYHRLLVDTCVTTSATLVRLATLPWPRPFDEAADAIGEDYALWLALAAGGPLLRVAGLHVHYRHHAASISQRVERFADMRMQHLRIVEEALQRRPAPLGVQRAARVNVYRQSAVRFLAHDQIREARRDLQQALTIAPGSSRLWALAALSVLSPRQRRRLATTRRRLRALLQTTAPMRRASDPGDSG